MKALTYKKIMAKQLKREIFGEQLRTVMKLSNLSDVFNERFEKLLTKELATTETVNDRSKVHVHPIKEYVTKEHASNFAILKKQPKAGLVYCLITVDNDVENVTDMYLVSKESEKEKGSDVKVLFIEYGTDYLTMLGRHVIAVSRVDFKIRAKLPREPKIAIRTSSAYGGGSLGDVVWVSNKSPRAPGRSAKSYEYLELLYDSKNAFIRLHEEREVEEARHLKSLAVELAFFKENTGPSKYISGRNTNLGE
jgi:hypothetical protein